VFERASVIALPTARLFAQRSSSCASQSQLSTASESPARAESIHACASDP
jgi:hypothetical protein